MKEWTLFYHGGGEFRGRGEFIRLMLEDAKIDFEYTGDNLVGPTGIMDCFRGGAEAILADRESTQESSTSASASFPSNPIFFPPAILHRPPIAQPGEEVLINQVAACMMYVGAVLGYSPSLTSYKEKAIADSITLNAMDYIARGRDSFHPVENAMSYNDQKEEGDKASLLWTQEKMPCWLAHFEKVVKVHGAKSPVTGGSSVTYADFALFHVLDATVHQFNNEKYNMAWEKQTLIPTLKEYYQWMKARPNIKAYQESDRAPAWAGDSMM